MSRGMICVAIERCWRVGLVVGVIALLGAAPSVGESRDHPARRRTPDGATMVLVDGGAAILGDAPGFPDGVPPRHVDVSPFYIDRLEVTNGQYRRFLDRVAANGDAAFAHPDQPADKDHTPRYWKPFRPALLVRTGMAKLQRFDAETFRRDDHPVVGIDWWDAYAYARWAGKRLPDEAEWELAARGIEGRIWPWGDEWDFGRCNSGGYEWKGERDGHIYTAPADSFPKGASPYGCLQMAGNVAEWVRDESPDGPTSRWTKGGGSSSYPSAVRAAARRGREPGFRSYTLGFRCAMTPPAPRIEIESGEIREEQQ